VCGNALRDVETLKDAAGRVWTLDHCGHLAHEECIRGWAIVGKRHVSPCCNEKLDAERIRGTNPWEAAAGAWTDLLDLLRNGLIFLPVYMLIRSAMARI
jgi:RING finger protein 121